MRMMSPCSPPQPPTPDSNSTGRKVFCVKFQKEMAGLDAPPWPGELGQRIYENVSLEAWRLWEERLKMILNEYRLMPWPSDVAVRGSRFVGRGFSPGVIQGSAAEPRYRSAASRAPRSARQELRHVVLPARK
jgi:Fe-S cluster biosynthesis and repair protein YggX